ncbi:MAG: glycosyl hydrolase family 28-related protein [Puniceicoccaceae bacterium]
MLALTYLDTRLKKAPRLLAWGFVLCAAAGLAEAREITYPVGSDIVIDITQAPYNADPTGVVDAGPIIQQAVLDAVEQQGPAGQEAAPIVYLPNGRYRIGTPVVLETETPGGQWRMLQGQSKEGVVLFCDDNDPDFQDANNPTALVSFFEGDWTNNAFTNLFENFTVEVGAGNPGAVGVRFHGNNVARLENVRIVSLDPEGVGAIGLDLKESISAPGIIKHVEVEGFDIGVDIANPGTTAQAWTIDELTIRNQNVVGIQSYRKAVQITDLVSVNTVPVYISQFLDGMVTLINADLSTPDGVTSEATAITMNGDFLYLRDITMSGYANLIDDNGVLTETLGPDEVYRNGPTYSVWDDALDGFAELPIVEIPDVPWEAPEMWEIVYPVEGDDTEVIQAALLSGAKTVFLYPGLYEITNSLRVGPDVQRIASHWARIQWRGELFESGGAIFYWEESNHDVVTIERLAANWWGNSKEYLLHNATNADMVLRDNFWVGGGVYRNEPTEGRLFVEDCHNVPGGQVFRNDLPSWIITNQQTWARQFNPEMAWPLLTVDGGTFWVSGFKFGEQQGPVVIARNQAVVEFLGGYMNVTHGVDLEPIDVPMIETHDAQVSIRLIERAGELYGPPNWNFRHRFISRETRNGETRDLSTRDDSIVHRDSASRNGPGWGGAMVPLYSSLIDPALYPGNVAPTIEAGASVAATVQGGAQLLAVATDSDGPAAKPAVHWRMTDGPGAAYFSDAASRTSRVRVSRPGTYTFVATASDGLLKIDSAPVVVEFLPEPETISLAGNAMKRLSDSAPRDGQADTELASIFLYAGDFRVPNTPEEMEIRLHMEAPVYQFAGRSGDIASATLHLTPKSLSNPPLLDVVRTTELDTGLVSIRDFSSDSTLAGQVEPGAWSVKVTHEVDVTAALKAVLDDGRDALAVQLRMSGGPNDDAVNNFVEFYGASLSTPQYDPYLAIELVNPPAFSVTESIALAPDGTGFVSPLNYLTDFGGGWWFSYTLSRLLFLPDESTLSSLWMYTAGLGWTWTQDGLFPFIYSQERAAWMYAWPDTAPNWFYDYSMQAWVIITPDGNVTLP